MLTNSDDRRQPPGFPTRHPGLGMAHRWHCEGCKQFRHSTAGSKGVGVRKRCKQCVEGKSC